MNNTAQYFIAQYHHDPFRHEPRNIGVIVAKNGDTAARFVGENESNQIDGRSLRWMPNPDIYRHWVESWRELIAEESTLPIRDRLLRNSGGNYAVIGGGEVTNTGQDSAGKICQFLFQNLVDVRREELVLEESTATQHFKADVRSAFSELNILSGNADPNVVHPVVVDTWLPGKSGEYNPAFFQQNGVWWIMETVNFTAQNKRAARDHACYAATMFKDVKAKHRKTEPIALVKAEYGDLDERNVKGILPALKNSGEVIMWDDPRQREEFLRQRQSIAYSAAV